MKTFSAWQSFRLEFLKSRRKPTILLVLALAVVDGIYLYAGARQDAALRPQPWQSMLFALSIINGIFLSILAAVLASRSMDLEHKGGTWYLLHTLQSGPSLYGGKLLSGLFWLTLFCLLQDAALLLPGKLLGIPGLPPAQMLLILNLGELAAAMALYELQCILSLILPNQFAALSVSMGGTLAGLFLMFVSRSASIPWTLIISLGVVRMDYDELSRRASYHWELPPASAYAVAACYLVLFLWGGLALYARMEEGSVLRTSAVLRRSRSVRTLWPAELIKLRRSPVWIAFFALPLVSACIGTINFIQNQGVLSFTWDSLWTQHSLFLGIFFLPPLIGIFCSLLWRMEHTGTNWNLILTLESAAKLVRDKLLAAAGVSALCMLWTALLFILCGKLIGLDAPVPAAFGQHLLFGIFACAVIASFQSFLSLVIRSFAVPVGIAAAGSLGGMMCLAKGWDYALPFSLLQLGMGSTNLTESVRPLPFLLAGTLYIALCFGLSVLYIRRTDVKTHE